MTPERWQRVCDLFTAAQRCDPAAREAMLLESCGSDEALGPRSIAFCTATNRRLISVS